MAGTGGNIVMIPDSLFILLICNFTAIGLLPLLFFRADGEYNFRWIVTSAPFFAVPLILVLGRLGVLQISFVSNISLIAVPLSAASIALIALTVGTHRVPLALWHQENDAPAHLVTWGPYAYIRHPFYTSFLLAFAAAAIAFPHLLTLLALIYGTVALTLAAVREEHRLRLSEFGEDYLVYSSVSGRFFPRLLS
jgi:protein-S-isoprenylcysteine O-methyltransferase Ste14